VSTVGVVVNPIAGKDIRRLATAAGHTSDSAKIDIVRRAVIAAVESGAQRVLLAPDPHRLAERAVDGLGLPTELLDIEIDGSRHDTRFAAEAMWKRGVGVVVALGGDGTCRDIAIGWPDVVLIAMSTGTNNVFPSSIDATSAGAAAGLVAAGLIDVDTVTRRSKRLTAVITTGETIVDDVALVDLALIDTTFVGSRAVLDGQSVRIVVAAIASPVSTGLSSIAGRLHPVDRWQPGGVLVRLGTGGRRVRAPLSPGSFSTLDVTELRPLADGEVVHLSGSGVLAFDGERDRRLSPETVVSVKVDMTGPLLIDVDAALHQAAATGLFDVDSLPDRFQKDHHGY
jgi:predicted polyphosphate/ATP-dependent NAD kinase